MRKREKDRQVKKAIKEIDEALKPFPKCCKRRIFNAALVLLCEEPIF